MGQGKKTAYTPLDPDVNAVMETLTREQKKIPYRMINEVLRQHFKMNEKNMRLLQLSIREAEIKEQTEKFRILYEESEERLESIQKKKEKEKKR